MKLQLPYPVTPFYVNQGFGGNYATYHQFGLNGHNGLDLRATHGQPVYACHDGTVLIETDVNQGHGVVLISDSTYDFEGKQVKFKTIYWHLCDGLNDPKYPYPVKTGQKVKRGDLIGYADNTGFSTGDHLHFGLKPIADGEDPFSTYNLKQNNGYGGAIDPTPYFTGSTMTADESFHAKHPELSPEVTEEQYNRRQKLFRYFYKLFTGRDL